jgi:hypothetical protein
MIGNNDRSRAVLGFKQAGTMTSKILATLLATAAFVVATPTFAQDAPTVATVQITPPRAGTDPTLAKFSGRWQGKWNNGPYHNLAVERIDGPRLIGVVYTLGAYPSWGKNFEVSKVLGPQATFANGVLTLSHNDGSTVRYTLKGNTLSAAYADKNGRNPLSGTLTRVQ